MREHSSRGQVHHQMRESSQRQLREQDSIKIAARHSDLARLQAYQVGEALKKANPGLTVDYAFRASLGDLNQQDALWKMPEKGVFTEDFLLDLESGACDMVVHSWKDLPTHERGLTEIVATLRRADVRDLLLFRRDRVEAAKSSKAVRILTSSPRRVHNLGEFLKEHLPLGLNRVDFEPVRGNIPTRLKKLLNQNVDGLIVAKAAIDRLLEAEGDEFHDVQEVIRHALSQTKFMVLPLFANPTAAAQGALAIEIRRDRAELREILQKINCAETFATVTREREILASYGGGCHQKIGVNVLDRPYGRLTFLRGLTDTGENLDRVELSAKGSQPQASIASEIYPEFESTDGFFTRHPLERESWASAESEHFLWVSRDSAWPESFRAEENAIVWAAGLKTWRKLSERGIWVCGSAEGLGEDEDTRLAALVSGSAPGLVADLVSDLVPDLVLGELKWKRLAHQGASQSGLAVATYQLVPKTEGPDLRNKSHFYWMSGSQFDRALEVFPEIADRHHACGPGKTYAHIRKQLGAQGSLQIHLNLGAWRRAVLPRSE